jgi:hypothetical protein
MLKDLGVLESTFGDIHKGVKFKISFFKYPNGYTIEVRVDGLPVRKDDDNCWKTKDEARQAGIDLAHQLIDNA